MASEKEKMIAGELYRPGNPELVRDRARNRDLQRRYNATTVSDKALRQSIKAEQRWRRDRIARAALYGLRLQRASWQGLLLQSWEHLA